MKRLVGCYYTGNAEWQWLTSIKGKLPTRVCSSEFTKYCLYEYIRSHHLPDYLCFYGNPVIDLCFCPEWQRNLPNPTMKSPVQILQQNTLLQKQGEVETNRTANTVACIWTDCSFWWLENFYVWLAVHSSAAHFTARSIQGISYSWRKVRWSRAP